MAKKTSDPTKGSQREIAAEGNAPEGVTFRDLIQFATGTETPTEQEFESTMAARGYRSSDVRKLKKAFKEVNQSGKDYFLRDNGFDVFNEGQRESGSSRNKGNKRGADLGDILGLGNNVSLLAGALRNEKGAYDKAQSNKQEASQGNPGQAQLGQESSQSLSPEMEFSRTMKDLLGATASGSGKGSPAEGSALNEEQTGQSQGKQGKSKTGGRDPLHNGGPRFNLNNELMNWSPFDVIDGKYKSLDADTETAPKPEAKQPTAPAAQPASQAMGTDMRTKAQKGQDLLMGNRQGFPAEKGFFDINAEEMGLEAYGLGDAAVSLGTGAGYAAPWLGMSGKTRGFGNALGKAAFPLALTGVAMKGIGDAINPNEDVNWGELGNDAADIALFTLLNKVAYRNNPGAPAPAQLPGGSPMATPSGASALEKARQTATRFSNRFSNLMPAWAPRMTPKVPKPTVSGSGPLTPQAIEENFLMNLTDDLNALPIKRRGGVITKYRGY